MSENQVIMNERTNEHRQALDEYHNEADISGASVGEIANDFVHSQVEDWEIKPSTAKGKISAFDRWSSILKEAGIDTVDDLSDRPRRAHLFEVFNTNLEDGRIKQSYALKRQVELLGEMLTVAKVPKGIRNKVIRGIQQVIKQYSIETNYTIPYTADQTKLALASLEGWALDRTTCPSINDGKATGKRQRAPSQASINRLWCTVTIGAITNARLSGIKTISLDDVDLENLDLTYRVTKGKVFTEPCTVRIPEWAVPAIANHVSFLRENRPNATHICCGDNGNAGVVHDSSMTRPLRRMMEHLGIVTGDDEKAGFHRFRASATMAAFKAGESADKIGMGLLRHSDGGKLASQTYGHHAKDSVGNEMRSHWLDDIKPDVKNIQELTVDVPEWETLRADVELISAMRAEASMETGTLAHQPSLSRCTYENGELVSRDVITGVVNHSMVTPLSRTMQVQTLHTAPN